MAISPCFDSGDWGMKVLKFDGAIAPRVLKFDSGYAAEGCGGRHRDKPLWGLRVLKFDGAIAPKVLKFDAPPARGLWWRL